MVNQNKIFSFKIKRLPNDVERTVGDDLPEMSSLFPELFSPKKKVRAVAAIGTLRIIIIIIDSPYKS